MISFLGWCRSILLSVLNGIAKAVVLVVFLLIILIVAVLAWGDGVPVNAVLTLDLREAIADSDNGAASFLHPRRVTVMDLILGLDAASRDARIKGVEIKLGNGAVSVAQAEEITTALARFHAKGKFVIAQASGFNSPGLGDYLTASAADEIWVQPKSDFATSGAGGGEIFLKGLFDKIEAVPQIAKRADYKSAADMYMEPNMTGPDREQLTRMMQSVYDSAVDQMAAARHITRPEVIAALEKSPQFSEDAKAARLIDHIGYDDEADASAIAKAGQGAKPVKMGDYLKARDLPATGANIALIEASGEIVDGTAKDSLFGSTAGIASDDLSEAIRAATRDSNIKAIILRVDSPGGSVSASDQILHAVKGAQAAGKPVVVSMGSVAASGGYYISASANRIIAEPATLTGSIGVLTGKVSFDKSLAKIGVGTGQVSVGKNTLMDSPLQAYSTDQWAALNHEADVIYDDFLHKVSAGRKLPFDQVQQVAKGRVWTGADAKSHGLVDGLGGFWTAADAAAQLAGVQPGDASLKLFPHRKGILDGLKTVFSGSARMAGTLERLDSVMSLPPVSAVLDNAADVPRGGVQLRAANLPQMAQ